jgi:transcriptional regulator with XRE-family HTH domain
MASPLPTYLRTHRRKWAFSQAELAELLGGITADAVSKYETLARPPSVALIIACEFIFEETADALFPALSLAIVREILRNAEAMRTRFADQDDAPSVRKCRLIDNVITRSKEILDL